MSHGLHLRFRTFLVTHESHTELLCFPSTRQTQNGKAPSHREGTHFGEIPVHRWHMGGHPLWVTHERHSDMRVRTFWMTQGRHTELSCFPTPRQTQNSKTVYHNEKVSEGRSPRLLNHREGTHLWVVPLHGWHMGGHPFWVTHGRHTGRHHYG